MVGWPRFKNKAKLVANKPWSRYLELVYGELPEKGYPICIYDLWTINITAYREVGLDKVVSPTTDHIAPKLNIWTHGELHEWKTVNPDLQPNTWISGFWIYHSYRQRRYAADDTWIEVTHTASGATGEDKGLWLFFAPGSGIWFNVGKTKIFSTHEAAAFELCGFNCSTIVNASCDDTIAECGKQAGLDSIQFQSTFFYTAEYYELLATKYTGAYACGVEGGNLLDHSTWRSGWQASRECRCNANDPDGLLNCNGDTDGSAE